MSQSNDKSANRERRRLRDRLRVLAVKPKESQRAALFMSPVRRPQAIDLELPDIFKIVAKD